LTEHDNQGESQKAKGEGVWRESIGFFVPFAQLAELRLKAVYRILLYSLSAKIIRQEINARSLKRKR
jgi:hypothetical protein